MNTYDDNLNAVDVMITRITSNARKAQLDKAELWRALGEYAHKEACEIVTGRETTNSRISTALDAVAGFVLGGGLLFAGVILPMICM